MMSHEDRHQPGEDEDGEDEEGDIEARTAVEALLALTSPTDYTHHSAYEEEYIVEPINEEYQKVEEKEDLEVYNSLEEEEVTVEESSSCVRVVRPVTVALEDLSSGDVRQVQVTDTKELNPSDEGLKQLRAFVQATEGRREANSAKAVHGETGVIREGGKSVYVNKGTAVKGPVMGQREGFLEGKARAQTEPAKDASEGSAMSDRPTVLSAAKRLSPVIDKRKCVGESVRGLQNAITGHMNSVQVSKSGVIDGGRLGIEENLGNAEEGSSGSESEAPEFSGVGREGGTQDKAEQSTDSSDSDDGDDNEENGDSDSSSSSSGSNSSSDDESDTDGSDSDSDSESDPKCSEEQVKVPTTPENSDNKKVDVKECEKTENKLPVKEVTVKEARPSELRDQGKVSAQAVQGEEGNRDCQTGPPDLMRPGDKVRLVGGQGKVTKPTTSLKEDNSREVKATQKEGKSEVGVKCLDAQQEGPRQRLGATRDCDNLSSSSSDLERKKENPKDRRKHVSLPERRLSAEIKNCVSRKLGEAEKVTTSVKLLDEREKLFNNNSISITKSQASLKVNNFSNKKSSFAKNGTRVGEQPVTNLPTLTPRTQTPASCSMTASREKSQVDLVQEVAVAFAQQLSSIQANQLRNATSKPLHLASPPDESRCPPLSFPCARTSDQAITKEEEEEDEEEEEKVDSEIEDMFPMPIQAEVVMSEGSESSLEYEPGGEAAPHEDLSWCGKGSEVLDQSEKENMELMAYLRSYVNGTSEGELVEYPPSNNDLPSGGRDLTQWQLEGVRLPPFTPTVAPPSWLRLTIPAEGYRCQSCDDTFFIESSLVQHRERRSVWISLECGPCDAKLTFYNRCALKDHLRNHMLHGEEVDEETVEVRSLPLQLTRLLQPIVVPVPHSLRTSGKLGRNLKAHGSVNKLPVLKPIGRCAATRLGAEYHSSTAGDATFPSDDHDDGGDQDDDLRSSTDKIPPGIKRLSPRKRTVRCYLCERMFHSVRELMAHMRTDQPYSDQRVECKKCQLVLPSVCAAKAHILTHPPANTSNISVCPECGSRCDGPREFVHHLNTCGHQYRRSGVVCTECQVCFFRSQDDFLTHWIAEHCAKSYECVVCRCTFESLVFHRCTSPGQQVLATFRCLLTCPLCSASVQLHAQEEQDTNAKIRAHLAEAHPTIITRVHYVYKSKFCTNAFRSKDELRAHHDREHRRDNHYRTKTCTLHHEVLGYQHQYFSGQEPRNAFVTLPVALSAEELHEARIRDVPTVSSVIDKTLFPDLVLLEAGRGIKVEKGAKNKTLTAGSPKEGEVREGVMVGREMPVKKDMDQLDKLRPKVCYRCGTQYADTKDFRRHKRTCEGEAAERQCRLCGLTAVGEDFARHCLSHIQDGAILCIYCNGAQFASHGDLEQHFELHVHEQFSYPASCAFCCTSLPDVPTALAHLTEEHDPLHVPFDASEFECDRCGRRFHGERGLSVHLGRCTLGTATPTPASAGCRQCQVCTKALTPEMFGRHMVCHLEEGLLVCSLCDGRTLPSSMALLHHLEEHASALAHPSACPMCSSPMQDASSALTHLKEEHGFGNLHCADCDMHFNFTYQLQRHTDIVHKICQYAKRRYICWICRAYDHVKKETLMNHFRTVHGLDRQQVDEKVMIRTRGQGTMPTSQFIPTKPLGSKENQGVSAVNKECDATQARSQRDKSKVSPSKSSTATESPVKQAGNCKSPVGRHLKDSPQKSLTSQESPEKDEPPNPGTPAKDSLPRVLNTQGDIARDSLSPHNPTKMTTPERMDVRLKDKTKVLVKRLPDSILDEESRSKRRRMEGQVSEAETEAQEGVGKEAERKKKKKKKKKAYKCQVCAFGTNFKDKMDIHLLKHKENGEVAGDSDGFVCRECGASFVVEPSLARHMFFAHKVKLHMSSADENEDKEEAGATVIKTEPEPVIVETETKVTIKEEAKEETETTPAIDVNESLAKRKVVRETVRKKMESESIKRRADARSRRGVGDMTSLKRKPTKPLPRKRPEKAPVPGTKRKDPVKRKTGKEASRRGQAVKREAEEDKALDNQCIVCKEEFTNPVELYSHLRTHGMAFLKLGRKARPLGLGKPLER